MKKLEVSFEGTTDTTGYLFSLTKGLSAVLRCSEYQAYADDMIAASGFAFRMWVASDLCPSAMSIWEFKKQKEWVENGGIACAYVERMWEEEALEEERRLQALQQIKSSIDNGMAAVAWDISGGEWGIIKGYDDEKQELLTLRLDSSEASVPYDKLGKLEIPILSVLTVVGANRKSDEQLVADTKKLAAAHLRGEEWCENAKGLSAYDALIAYISEKYTVDDAWALKYYLGTYAALKWYAWRFFEKYREVECAKYYEDICNAWKSAFDIVCRDGLKENEEKKEVLRLLGVAKETEGLFLKAIENREKR